MAETFELYFDGSATKQKDVPDMRDFKEVIERDYEIRGIVLKYPNTVTFFGDSYTYLLKEYRRQGFCGEVAVTINRLTLTGSDQSLKGIIFLSDISWNWDETTCEATIEDDNWSARIVNNIDLNVNLLTEKTKLGNDMSTTVSLRKVETFDPAAVFGTYSSSCEGLDVITAFSQILLFITDNIVTFSSSFLTNDLGADTGILITTGLSLRTAGTDTIEISLSELLRSLSKVYNLWFDLEDNQDGTYTFRLEPESYWFNTSENVKFQYIKGIQQSTMDDSLYAGVKVGSRGRKSLGGGVVSLDYYRAITHLEEEYYVAGGCNIDDKLDLFNRLVYDTNAIEDIVTNSNDDWDDDLFLMEYTPSTNKATKNKYATNDATAIPPFYYNETFLNSEVLARYTFQNDIGQSFGNEDEGFEAGLAADSGTISSTTVLNPLIFVTEISDPSNNYDPVSGRFLSPANGTYTFRITLPLAILSKTEDADTITIKVDWVHRDNTTTIFKTVAGTAIDVIGVNSSQKTEVIEYVNTITTYLEFRDTLEPKVTITLNKANPSNTITMKYYKENARFETLSTYDGGGIYFEYEPQDYRAALLEFAAGIADDIWEDLKDDKGIFFEVDRDGVTTMTAWIKKLERDFLTSETSVQLVTNLDQVNKIGT